MDNMTAKVKDSYEMNSEIEQNGFAADHASPLTGYGEKTERTEDFTKIFFEWKNVNYVVTRAQAKDQKEMRVLNNVSGYANPGEMVVLMGSSGAGKTTLLNILCNRVNNDNRVKFEGIITANGTNIKDFRFKDYVGYVTQEDVMMATMTCRESLTFAATMKIKASKKKINSLVDEMLEHLRLTRVADVIVGSAIQKGISGGERKRVAIGIELISEPSIMFLDEPTSGLDSYTAGIVIDLLLEEAKKGRTIITTLHQPSAEIFKRFQRLILMMEGNIVYQGSAKHSRHYFRELGLETPKFVNPVDYYMEILHIKSRDKKSEIEKERLEMLCSAYILNEPELSKSKCKFNIDQGELTTIVAKSSEYKTSWLVQFREILKRSMKNTRRHPIVSKMLIVQTFWQTLFSVALWNTLPTDNKGVVSRSGYLFFIVLQQYFQGNSSMVLSCNKYTVPSEKHVIYKEESSGFYHISAYWLAKNLSTLPQQIILPFIMSCISYWVVELNDQVDKFFMFSNLYAVFIIVLSNIAGGSFGLLLGTLFPSEKMALPASMSVLSPMILFAGYLTTNSSMPISFNWIRYITPHKHSWQSMMINEFTDADLDCEECDIDTYCKPCDPLDLYSIDEDDLWTNIGALIIIIFGLRTIAGFLLFYYCKTGKGRLQ